MDDFDRDFRTPDQVFVHCKQMAADCGFTHPEDRLAYEVGTLRGSYRQLYSRFLHELKQCRINPERAARLLKQAERQAAPVEEPAEAPHVVMIAGSEFPPDFELGAD